VGVDVGVRPSGPRDVAPQLGEHRTREQARLRERVWIVDGVDQLEPVECRFDPAVGRSLFVEAG
jgi:hypothetical protein